jgi:hypothetical protein
MKRTRLLLPVVLILFVFSLLFTSITTEPSQARITSAPSGQDENLATVFRHHDLVKLDTASVAAQVHQTGQVSLSTGAKTFDLVLMPNDLRAKNYHAEVTGKDGVRRPFDSGPVRTFKGYVRGMKDAQVRLAIDDKTFQGMILTPDARYFIEPAQRFSMAASSQDFVLYDERDVIGGANLSCETTLGEKVNTAIQQFAPRAKDDRVAVLRVIEIATEADFPFVSSFEHGLMDANQYIIEVINSIDAVYQLQLGLTFRITFQHGWEGQDPYGNPTSQAQFLINTTNGFRGIWNTQFPLTNPLYKRDVAHMWTNRFPGSGLAVLRTVCRTPTDAYGFSGKLSVPPALISQRNALSAHEIGHSLGADHFPDPTTVPTTPAGCEDTIMITPITPTTALRFCGFSLNQINTYLTVNSGCLSELATKTRFDFDVDAKADLAVFRQVGGFWYITSSQTGGFSGQAFGTQGDAIAPEDFDGDGRTDLAVFRPSTGSWYLMQSRAGFLGMQFGAQGDLPVSSDYDGDGKADIAVYRPSTGAWYIFNSSNSSVSSYFFGVTGDLPTSGDFDGDARADIAVFRPSTGTWYIQQSRDGFRAEQFGTLGDNAVPADYDGDGKVDVAVFRPSNGGWYIQQSTAGFRGQIFGNSDDLPVAADYDGDGKADVAVWRKTLGNWYIFNSSNGAFRAENFGTVGDVPIPAAYVR